MKSTCTYQCVESTSTIAEIFDMIERLAPKMMISGGGSLKRELMTSSRRQTENDRNEILRLWYEGKKVKEIVEETGWSGKTVWNVTHSLQRRKCDRRRPA